MRCQQPPIICVLIWLIGIVLCCPGVAYSQHQALAFEHIAGLSSSSIESITQDTIGFIWIGTQGGLDQYDGRNLRTFKPIDGDAHSLSDEFIYAVLAARKAGTVWIGSRDGILNAYHFPTDHFTRYSARDSLSDIRSPIRVLFEDQDQRVWLGTLGGGLKRFDVATKTFVHYRHNASDSNSLASDSVLALYQAPSAPGFLWIGTTEGISRLDVAADSFLTYRHHPTDRNSLSHNAVTSFVEVSDWPGVLWIGTRQGGLNRFAAARGVFERFSVATGHLPSDEVSVVREDQKQSGTLWVGTRRGGLVHFDPRTEQATPYLPDLNDPGSLSHDDVRALYQDRTGLLWVGTWGAGLNKEAVAPRFWSYRHDPENPNSLSDPEVFYLYEAPSEPSVVWIGTSHGLNRLDRTRGTFTYYFTDPSHPLHRVLVLYEDAASTLWMGSRSDSLYQFDRATGQAQAFSLNPADNPGFINEIYESQHEPGLLWIATSDAGIYTYDTQNQHVAAHYFHAEHPDSLSHNDIWDIHESDATTLWFGTSGGGLNKLDRATKRFTAYRHRPDDPESISSDRVVSIQEDEEAYLWLGTSDKGLNRFNPRAEKATRYTQADGLPHTDVGGILIDDTGTLWMITSNGLSRFHPEDSVFTNFFAGDGLQGNVFRYLSQFKNERGELFVGGPQGFNVFHPDSIALNTTIPNVVITNVLVDGEAHRLERTRNGISPIELTYDRNDLVFRFAALDYTDPSKNRYRVILEGADDGWKEPETPGVAGYPNQPPGTYTFRVIGSNNDGFWGEEVSVIVTITPPFYKTWWFWTLIASLVLGLVVGAFQYRIYHLKREERTRQRIADDLHDDIGSKMSSIALDIEMAGRLLELDGENQGRLDEVAGTARAVVDDLRDTVWIVDADYDNLGDLITRMKQVTGALVQGCRYRFYKPEPTPDVPLKMEQRRHLFLFFKEALHNVARHAEAAYVEVRVVYEAGRLTIEVQDDGIGFDTETVGRGRGLTTMRKRVEEELGGTLMIESAPGQGATVRLTVKIA